MQIRCTKCKEKKVIKPCNLKKNGTTPETYICIDCYLKQYTSNRKPNWIAYRKMLNFARGIDDESIEH